MLQWGLQMAGVPPLVPFPSVMQRAAHPLGLEMGPGQPAQLYPCSLLHSSAAAPGTPSSYSLRLVCLLHKLPSFTSFSSPFRGSKFANAARKLPSQVLAVVLANREKPVLISLAVHAVLTLICRQLQTLAVYVKPQSQLQKI